MLHDVANAFINGGLGVLSLSSQSKAIHHEEQTKVKDQREVGGMNFRNGKATSEEVINYAEQNGIILSLSTLGPGFRAVARPKYDQDQILGYCEGFVRPTGNILHIDKLEVWKQMLDRAQTDNPNEFVKNGGAKVFGVSMLLGYLCLDHGDQQGCNIVEFLAIDDEEFQHKRLVRFFKRAGFKVIRYVGEDLVNVPDRLVWGGCGTLMSRDIESLLYMWTKIVFDKK